MGEYKTILTTPIFRENPIAYQILGICSALAVTSKLETSIVMSLAVIFVLSFANLAVSLFRGLPVGGSLSSTALVVGAGARSRWANVFTGLFAILAVLLLGNLIESLPMTALAAMLVFAGFSSFNREYRVREGLGRARDDDPNERLASRGRRLDGI